MMEARKIIGEDADSCPEFIDALRDGIEQAPRYPSQISLLDESDDLLLNDVKSTSKKQSLPKPKPDAPPNQYRVEVWRQSKRDKKIVKVTKL
jgi:hypothetical protein